MYGMYGMYGLYGMYGMCGMYGMYGMIFCYDSLLPALIEWDKLLYKGTVSVDSKDTKYKDDIARFSTAPFKSVVWSGMN